MLCVASDPTHRRKQDRRQKEGNNSKLKSQFVCVSIHLVCPGLHTHTGLCASSDTHFFLFCSCQEKKKQTDREDKIKRGAYKNTRQKREPMTSCYLRVSLV